MVERDEKSIVIIFAKAPDPGAVKTRLAPRLTVEARSRLQTALLLDTLHLTDLLSCERAIAAAPDVDHPFFRRCAQGRPLRLFKQQGETLGERMQQAFAWGFGRGFQRVILIGSDAPTLPAAYLEEALARLGRAAVVIGPSRDGGYYLIGARPPLPDLFSGIAWGGDQVFLSTLKKINAARIDCHLLPFWYDIDRPDDLLFLKEEIDLLARQGRAVPKETADFLSALSLKNPEKPA